MTPPIPRIAGADEAAEVARLLHDFNTEFDTASPGVEVLTTRLETLLTRPSMFAILAGVPAVAVGLVSVRPNVWYDGHVALLDELYVVPDRRNEGIGAAMLTLLRATARRRDIDAIAIEVDEGDVDAQRFYERHGYTSIEPATNERAFAYYQEFVTPA